MSNKTETNDEEQISTYDTLVNLKKYVQDVEGGYIDETADISKAIKLCQSLLDSNNENADDNDDDAKEDKVNQSLLFEMLLRFELHQNNFIKVIDLIRKRREKQQQQQNDNSSLSTIMITLEAYSWYRLGKYENAYDALKGCKEIIIDDNDNDNDDDTISLEYVHAQTLFRTYRTNESIQSYNKILDHINNNKDSTTTASSSSSSNSNSKMEVLTNAIAVGQSNVSPNITLPSSTNTTLPLSSIINEAEQLLFKNEEEEENNKSDYPFDLAYNLATFLSLTNLSGDSNGGKKSNLLLKKSKISCIASLQEDDDVTKDDINKEVSPIQTNIQYNNMLNSNSATANSSAVRQQSSNNKLPEAVEFVQNMNQYIINNNNNNNNKSSLSSLSLFPEKPNKNWTATQKRIYYYNLAVLCLCNNNITECKFVCNHLLTYYISSSSSTTSSSSDNNDNNNNGSSSTTTTVTTTKTKKKMSVAQRRFASKNKQQQKSSGGTVISSTDLISIAISNIEKDEKKSLIKHPITCKSDEIWWKSRIVVLQAYCCLLLSSSSSTSTSTQKTNNNNDNDNNDNDDNDNNDTNGDNNEQQQEEKKQKINKGYDDAITLLTNQLNEISLPNNNIKDSVDDVTIEEYAWVYIKLYLEEMKNQQRQHTSGGVSSGGSLIKLIDESLPKSIQNSPGTIATLISLLKKTTTTGDDSNKRINDLILKLNDNQALADYEMSCGNFHNAIKLYETLLKNEQEEKDNDENENRNVLIAKYIHALTYVDSDRAQDVWDEHNNILINNNNDDDDDSDNDNDEDNIILDAEELENKQLPRFSVSTSSSSSSSKAIITSATTPEQQQQQQQQNQKKKKKSHESILRRRARKREQYIQEKNIEPNKQGKADPERWVSKHELSRNKRKSRHPYNRYGRGGGGSGGGGGSSSNIQKGHQGGASVKDASKLDVLARKQLQEAGGDINSGPSTAHMQVTGNTKRRGRK